MKMVINGHENIQIIAEIFQSELGNNSYFLYNKNWRKHERRIVTIEKKFLFIIHSKNLD